MARPLSLLLPSSPAGCFPTQQANTSTNTTTTTDDAAAAAGGNSIGVASARFFYPYSCAYADGDRLGDAHGRDCRGRWLADGLLGCAASSVRRPITKQSLLTPPPPPRPSPSHPLSLSLCSAVPCIRINGAATSTEYSVITECHQLLDISTTCYSRAGVLRNGVLRNASMMEGNSAPAK